MDDTAFLNDKLVPGTLPDVCAPRHKLIDTFRKAADKRLIFVSAPAGYGKTVSTRLWLHDSGRRTVWIGLDMYDNSPAIFYKLLCQGLLSVQPENENMRRIMKSDSFSSSPVEHTISLISEFTADTALCALLLDDMHYITNEEIHKSLCYIIRRLPHCFVTLFLSRNEPSEEIAEYGKTGKAFFIGAEDLRFSEDEIRSYFASHGRFLSVGETETVRAITGGWAMGVNAIAKSGSIELGKGGGLDFENYIQRQIWDRWDERLRDFILKTSILDEMPVELCVTLTGREDSEAVLDGLCAENSFVSKLSEGEYRYHNLFLDFARKIFSQQYRPGAKELHKAAAAWFREKGDSYSVVRYAIRGDDYETVAAAMLDLCQYSTTGSSVALHVSMLSIHVLDIMPDSFLDNAPYLLISYTWYYYLLGNAKLFIEYLDKLYDKLPEIMVSYAQFLELALLITTLDFRNTITGTLVRMNQKLIAEVAERKLQPNSLTQNLPFLHRSHRDYSCYAKDIDENMREFKKAYSVVLKENYPYIEDTMRAGLYYEKNMLKEAVKYADRAAGALLPSTVAELIFTVGVTRAAILFAMGRDDEGGIRLAETKRAINTRDAQYLLPNLSAYEAKERLIDGDAAAARDWLDNYFVIEAEHPELYKVFQHLTTARACVVLGQTEKAMGNILKIKQLGVDFNRPLDIAEAGVLQAVLEWHSGNRNEAQATLENVLTAMQPYRFIRVVADEGLAVLPLLKKIAAKVKKDNYQGILESRYVNEVYLAAYEQSKRRHGIITNTNANPVKLSKQQRLVLSLLARGSKNSEIVKETGLTINTIKTHTRVAYDKLDVNNAYDAVLKARELGIIE